MEQENGDARAAIDGDEHAVGEPATRVAELQHLMRFNPVARRKALDLCAALAKHAQLESRALCAIFVVLGATIGR